MDGVQQLDEIIPRIEKVVEQIRADQLDNPTACANFTVTGVLERVDRVVPPTSRLPSVARQRGPLGPLKGSSSIGGAEPWPSY